MNLRRSLGQLSVDRTRHGMHQVGPAVVMRPQMTSTLATEEALVVFGRAIDVKMLFALDLHRPEVASEVDHESTTPGLSTDRAVAALVWPRFVTLE